MTTPTDASQVPAIPVTDPTGQAPAAPGPTATPAPWERDGVAFDAQRAWTLIENLRADLAAKGGPAPAAPAANATAAGAPSNPPPAVVPGQDAVAAQVEALRLTVAQERAARKHGLDDDLIGLLGTGTDAEIDARAKVIAERLVAATAPTSPVTRRPVAQLRGGSDPGAPVEETDPAKLADTILSRTAF